MYTRLYLPLLLLFFGLFSAMAVAQPDPVGAALNRMKKNVVFATLSNGLRVIMYRRPNVPVFAGVVSVHLGGVNEVPGETGASHLLEHMAFKGTDQIGTSDYGTEEGLLLKIEQIFGDGRKLEELSESERVRLQDLYDQLSKIWVKDEFSRMYKKVGASGMNATTGKELTNYFVNLPSSALEHWCWLESERILNPVMRQFYKERDVVLEERRMRYEDDPGGKLYETLLSSAYHVHPFRNPVIGYKTDVERLTVSDVWRFHRKYYVPSNIVIGLVGDIDPSTTLPMLERYFGKIPAGEKPGRPKQVEPEQVGERIIAIEHPSEPQIGIAYRKPNYPHPDDPAIGMMLEVFAESRTSPLYRELVEEKKLATGFASFEAPGVSYPNLAVFYGDVRHPHSTDELIREFDRVLARFKRTGPTAEQMTIAKRSLSMAYLTMLRSNMSLARDLVSTELNFGDWKATLDWYEKVMMVNQKDVKRVAKQYFTPARRTVGFIRKTKG